jgi:hypothetical protein
MSTANACGQWHHVAWTLTLCAASLMGCAATPTTPDATAAGNRPGADRQAGKPDVRERAAGTASLKQAGEPLPPQSPDIPALRFVSLKFNTDGPMAKMFGPPSNRRDWSPDQAVLPAADFHDNLVTVHNIRNNEYRTVDDYTVHYYDKTFDLRKLTSVDFIVVPFDDMPSIAHVMLSFGFEDKDYLVTSVEIRKERKQAYNTLAGFFRQYELMYVLADERDVIWKNSIGWLAEVYVYRTKATPDQARKLLVDVLRRVNKLADVPEFYNTLSNNCTTNVRDHVNRLWPDRIPYDYRVLLPGYSDRLAYDSGLLATDKPFADARAAALVNYQAYLYRDDPDFSQKIRQAATAPQNRPSPPGENGPGGTAPSTARTGDASWTQ